MGRAILREKGPFMSSLHGSESDMNEIRQLLPYPFEFGEVLPPAVIVDKNKLSTSQQERIQSLTGANTSYFIKTIVMNWAVIFALIAVARYFNHIVLTCMVIFLIGTRQNILGLLAHDQVHRLGFPSKMGDGLTNLFVAWPLLFLSVESYAKVHIAHHAYYFTKNDPDFIRKNGKDWRLPLTMPKILSILLKDMLGIHLIETIRSKKGQTPLVTRTPYFSPWVRFCYYACFAALFTYYHLWEVFILYWVIPLVVVLQVIVRLGALCEHKYDIWHAEPQNSTPLIIPSWWEKILLPNLNFTYHIYHHIYPNISCAKLPDVHRIYQEAGLVRENCIFHGCLAYIKYLMHVPHAK